MAGDFTEGMPLPGSPWKSLPYSCVTMNLFVNFNHNVDSRVKMALLWDYHCRVLQHHLDFTLRARWNNLPWVLEQAHENPPGKMYWIISPMWCEVWDQHGQFQRKKHTQSLGCALMWSYLTTYLYLLIFHNNKQGLEISVLIPKWTLPAF